MIDFSRLFISLKHSVLCLTKKMGRTTSYPQRERRSVCWRRKRWLSSRTLYAQDTVTNAKALAEALAAEGFDVLAEERGYTASHQVLTRHGETDSGAGRTAAALLEEAGIITNMNMLPGDTRALSPSGLRLGVQELTRHGMGPDQMQDVATCFRRVLLDGVDPAQVKGEVAALREGFTDVQYCFEA